MPKKGDRNNPDGRDYAPIEWETVEKLCGILCTGDEIAAIVGVHYDTLAVAIKREYDVSFPDYYKKHSSKGKASLRRAQYKLAVDGNNPTMLVWLGKQHLGQADKIETDNTGQVNVTNLPLNEYKSAREKMLKDDDC